MSLRGQRVVLPCVSFGVKLRLGQPGGGLSPMEQVALEAIALGVRSPESLGDILGLGRRPTLDLLLDFWRKGWVWVEENGTVQLSGEAEKAAQTGKWEALKSSEQNMVQVRLIQELLTGAVLPLLGSIRPEGANAELVPCERNKLDLSDVARTEIRKAAELELERQKRAERAERNLEILEAWLEPEDLLREVQGQSAGIGERRYLSLWVDVRRDLDSHVLVFTVVHAPDVPITLWSELGRALSRGARKSPELTFYRRLTEALEPAATPTYSKNVILHLQQRAGALATADAGVVADRHRDLLPDYHAACDEVIRRTRAQGLCRLVVGAEATEAEVSRQLQEAKTQVILVNPWVTEDALIRTRPGGSWYDQISAALRRQVQVLLLWGIREDERLDPRVVNALATLEGRYRGLFLLSRIPSVVHAKVVVRDAAEALVSSYNFLQPPQKSSFELGVVLAGPQPGQCPLALTELLDWCRSLCPEHDIRQRVRILPEDLRAKLIPDPVLPPPPMCPTLNGIEPADRLLPMALWRSEWNALSVRLLAMSEDLGNGIQLITNAEHKELLWDALRSSHHRLGLMSDQLSVDVVTDRFVRLLHGRLEGGTPAVFVFRREGVGEGEDGPAAALSRLARDFPTTFRTLEARSHAKVLIKDDEVAIGSFNFLSYGAEQLRGRKERGEVSLHIHNVALVEELIQVLDQEFAGFFYGLRGRSLSTGSTTLPPLPPALQGLVQKLYSAPKPGLVLRDWFAHSRSPWEDMETLDRAELKEDLRELALAAFLVNGAKLNNDSVFCLQERLSLIRWQKGDFIGAAMLAPEQSALLPKALVRLGAALQAELPAETTGSVVDLAPSAAAALLLLGLVAVLRRHDLDLLPMLESLRASPTMQCWVKALSLYRKESMNQPFPIDLLQRSAGEVVRKRVIDEARRQANEALVEAEIIEGFHFLLGQRTWKLLLSPTGFLGGLRKSWDEDRPDQAQSLLQELPEGGVAELMDRLSSQVPASGLNRIIGGKRDVCLKRLHRVVETFHGWVAATQSPPLSPPEVKLLKACQNLSQGLGGLQDPVLSADDPVAAPALSFARQELACLLEMQQT